MVLIDSSPLLPVTDAAILTARTDGALIVVRSGRTTLSLLARALHNLERVKGRPLGVIINGSKIRGGAEATYYEYISRDDSSLAQPS
jgi:Mrp family chromosome partitioning ATPase